jgi:hypothetical protein
MSDSECDISVMSVKSNSMSQNPRVRRLRDKVTSANDHKRLTDLVFEYDDVIHHISTTTLNSWNPLADYKFAKSKGTVYITQAKSKYVSNKIIDERLEACEHNITLLQKYIETICQRVNLTDDLS